MMNRADQNWPTDMVIDITDATGYEHTATDAREARLFLKHAIARIGGRGSDSNDWQAQDIMRDLYIALLPKLAICW